MKGEETTLMSKSPSKSNVSVGSALSLAAEVTKALSPVLRGLSQEQVDKLRKNPLLLQEAFRQLISGRGAAICLQNRDTEFFLDNVVDEFGDKHEDVKLDLSRFAFSVTAKKVELQFALKIEANLIESVRHGQRVLSKQPVWSVEFEELVGMLSPEDSLVPTERVWYFGNDLEQKVTEEFVARHGVLKFGHEADNLFVGLEIGGIYLETPLSHRDARLFEAKLPVEA